MTGIAGSSETLAAFYQHVRPHIPEDCVLSVAILQTEKQVWDIQKRSRHTEHQTMTFSWGVPYLEIRVFLFVTMLT
jgi:hypothetical protein